MVKRDLILVISLLEFSLKTKSSFLEIDPVTKTFSGFTIRISDQVPRHLPPDIENLEVREKVLHSYLEFFVTKICSHKIMKKSHG